MSVCAGGALAPRLPGASRRVRPPWVWEPARNRPGLRPDSFVSLLLGHCGLAGSPLRVLLGWPTQHSLAQAGLTPAPQGVWNAACRSSPPPARVRADSSLCRGQAPGRFQQGAPDAHPCSPCVPEAASVCLVWRLLGGEGQGLCAPGRAVAWALPALACLAGLGLCVTLLAFVTTQERHGALTGPPGHSGPSGVVEERRGPPGFVLP